MIAPDDAGFRQLHLLDHELPRASHRPDRDPHFALAPGRRPCISWKAVYGRFLLRARLLADAEEGALRLFLPRRSVAARRQY